MKILAHIIIAFCVTWSLLILAACRAAKRPMPSPPIRVRRRREESDDDLRARALELSPVHRAACEKSINEFWGDE